MGEYGKLFSAGCFEIGVWRCHEPEPTLHAPEVAHGHHIVFPYTGCYVREAEGRRVFADVSRVLFEAPGDEYRIEHPAGGDHCLVVSLRPLGVEWLGARMRWYGDEPRFNSMSAPVSTALFVQHRRLHGMVGTRAIPRAAHTV
jgi:hypothetical protein